MSRNPLLITVCLSISASLSLVAQDQYGVAVGVAGERVLVLKPAAGHGPATLFSYARNAAGDWMIESRLTPENGANTGESFGTSFAVQSDQVLVGGGDPSGALGAHQFRLEREGSWRAEGRIAFAEDGSVGTGPTQLDLAGLMRIMQPPRRVLAIDDQVLAVGVLGGTARMNGVKVMRRGSPNGPWQLPARLEPVGSSAGDQLGAGLAVTRGLVAIGAPGHGARGAVFVFRYEAQADEWRQETSIVPDSTIAAAAFGTALTFWDDMLVVGAPGSRDTAGVLVVFEAAAPSGSWEQVTTIAPDKGTVGDRFGQALSLVDDRLWVGAPGASPGRAFALQREGDGFTFADEISSTEPGTSFGAAIGGNADLLVVGAPGANAGRGGAAIYQKSEASWSNPTWVSLGGEFERIGGVEVQCEEGRAAEFECGNVDLLAFLPISGLGGDPTERVSDMWGWTDPETGREYALIGRSGGIAFVDITQPTDPRYIGVLPGNRSGARDIKVYSDHLFFTGDGAGAHGLLVFDLQRLRSAHTPPVTFEPDARYDGIASAHNLVIDTDAGFAYPVGASGGGETCGGGLHMIDIRDPVNPAFAGCYTDTEGLIWAGRTHDAQCVVYRGPDARYRDRQICFASNETALRIVDVTEKNNPVPIAAATYPGIAYVHQGWLTEDHRYFYLDDELDELVGQTARTRTMIWDVAELDDPVLVGEYLGPDGATDHNLYVKGDRMYQANYQAGMRVVDISDPQNPFEVGFFDTTPYEGNPPGFNGAWTAFPFFESGTVVVTSMSEGIFLVRPRRAGLIP